MKSRVTVLSLPVLLALAFAATPAAAGVSNPYIQDPGDIALFSNGPAHANDPNAWQFNSGTIMSSSFYIGAASEVTEFSFTAWLYPGDVLQSAEVSITSLPNAGITYFDQTVNFTQSGVGAWQSSIPKCGGLCDVATETGSFAGVALETGTYYLNLQNGVTVGGNPVYWDENDGVGCTGWMGSGNGCPATAFANGTLLNGVSLDPDIFGTTNQTTPEPGSFLLLGSAIICVSTRLRRKRIS
jgi:hypothetical protein